MSVIVHWHYGPGKGALCGAQRAERFASRVEDCTCRLCVAMLASRGLLHGAVAGGEQLIHEKLAEIQRDPGVRLIASVVASVLRAARDEQR